MAAKATPVVPIICNVWRQNLDEEFGKIRRFVKDYPYIAFDTEFPGTVIVPMRAFPDRSSFLYSQVVGNANVLKVIQGGFCLMNERGELPPSNEIWQFNFTFSVTDDIYAVDSIDLLKRSGIDFERHRTHGVDPEEFGAMLTTSGLVVNEKVTWITFHACFDYAYLIKTIIYRELPETYEEFLVLSKTLFPVSYDIKMLLKLPAAQPACLRGGLQDIAAQLCVERVGIQHQAGSDSLLTGKTFFVLKNRVFGKHWEANSAEFPKGIDGSMSGKPILLSELTKHADANVPVISHKTSKLDPPAILTKAIKQKTKKNRRHFDGIKPEPVETEEEPADFKKPSSSP